MSCLKARFPGRGVCVPQHSSWSAWNPAKYLPISSSLQEGNSGKPSLLLKMTIMAFGWFVAVLWVITDNSADGNLIIQASPPHFVWVKSVFSSLWVQLMLTKPGAVCNHTSFLYHLLSPLVRKTLLFIIRCQVNIYALGIVQKSPLCHIIGIHILVCPKHIPPLSLLIFPIQFPTMNIILLVNWLLSTIWIKGCKG